MATTPSQTVGPFFAIELPYGDGPYVVPEGTPGAIWLRGRVFDGAGEPVPDALVESWQADPAGAFGGAFRGFGRSGTDEEGRWAILTLKPGPIARPGTTRRRRPPTSTSPSSPAGSCTRSSRACTSPTRSRPTPPTRCSPASTSRRERPSSPARVDGGYELDIHLQGPHETTFFAV